MMHSCLSTPLLCMVTMFCLWEMERLTFSVERLSFQSIPCLYTHGRGSEEPASQRYVVVGASS